jgi:signal peptidase II
MLGFGAFIVIIDQTSKWIVTHSLGNSTLPSRRVFLYNRAVSLLGANRRLSPAFLALLILFVVISASLILLIHFKIAYQNPLGQLGLAGAMGGAASNLLDRVWRNGVVDFIDLGFWPLFNFADIAICLGILIALVYYR